MKTFGALEATLFALLLLVVWSMYRAQRNKEFIEFNLFDLIFDNGKLSRLAVVFFGAFIFHTWVLARLTIDAKITEGYLTFYGLTWAAPIIAKMFANPPPASTATMTTAEQPTNESSK